MPNHNTLKIEQSCRQLIKSFEKQISWEWDGRFETALAQFNVKDKEWAHKIIENHMGNIWVAENKKDAPAVIKDTIKSLGGLEPGQKLYTSAIDDNGLILCAWWPWGNGETISIRIGIIADSLSEEENKELDQMLRTWFNL